MNKNDISRLYIGLTVQLCLFSIIANIDLSTVYIACIFRGYKCFQFSLIKHVYTANIYTHEFNIACMHAAEKAAIPRKPF